MGNKIAITGYSGFIGKYLVEELKSHYELNLLGRNGVNSPNQYKIDLNDSQTYHDSLSGCFCVIHCAARVHIMDDDPRYSFDLFKKINVEGTLTLAKKAASSGVKRFIYLSSIKVNGESTSGNSPFLNTDVKFPSDDYGKSKAQAEDELLEFSKQTEMEVVIIRPPLVYGPGVKANFSSLLSLINKGLPLPFGRVTKNRRSLVSIRNLASLIITCIEHPKAANQLFLVSDDYDMSTYSMVKEMSISLKQNNIILPIPLWSFNLMGKLFAKEDFIDRLLGSLQVDIRHTKVTLGWTPPQTIQEAFKETGEAFLKNKSKNK